MSRSCKSASWKITKQSDYFLSCTEIPPLSLVWRKRMIILSGGTKKEHSQLWVNMECSRCGLQLQVRFFPSMDCLMPYNEISLQKTNTIYSTIWLNSRFTEPMKTTCPTNAISLGMQNSQTVWFTETVRKSGGQAISRHKILDSWAAALRKPTKTYLTNISRSSTIS